MICEQATLTDSFQGIKDGLNAYIREILMNSQFELKDKTDVSLIFLQNTLFSAVPGRI